MKPFYQSPEWVDLMARLKRERGNYCQDPEHPAGTPRHGHRLFGDHIRELSDGGSPLDPRNIMLRCGACHTRKTARERAARYAARPVP